MSALGAEVVTLAGRFAALPNRILAREIERRGGTVRRGLSHQTTLLAVGRHSAPLLADGRLQARLARAEEYGARCIGESALLRWLGLLPPAEPVHAALRLEELPEKAGIAPELARLLELFDLIQPQDGACSFRDLVAAREIARLAATGLELAGIIMSAVEVGRGRQAAGDHPLARLKLVCDEQGRLARRIGESLAELDGQLRLPLANPGNPSVDEIFEAAEEAEQQGDLAFAEALYRRCTNLDRGDPIAPFNLANVLREQGRLREAKSYLQLAVAIDPGFADGWYNLGLLLEAEGRKDLARTYLEYAAAADPDYADPLYCLAKLHFEAGELAAAARLWQRYLKLDPDSEWSRLARRGLTLCRAGEQAGTTNRNSSGGARHGDRSAPS
jgi:tetratricopeptide (TPR) repeat protein